MGYRIAHLVGGLTVILAAAAAAFGPYPLISVEELRDRMHAGNGAVLVDVRPVDEYRSGHVPGAVSIPAERFTASRRLLPKDKSTTVILYCRGTG